MATEINITPLGFTSNGMRLYHVRGKVETAGVDPVSTEVNVPCMQILEIVPTGSIPAAYEIEKNTLTITVTPAGDGATAHFNVLVIGA